MTSRMTIAIFTQVSSSPCSAPPSVKKPAQIRQGKLENSGLASGYGAAAVEQEKNVYLFISSRKA